MIRTSNLNPEGVRLARNDDFISAYLGSVLQISPSLSLLTNIGRSYRFPSISELFYSGLTGRGTVLGNSGLVPEKSLNMDFGLRYLRGSFYASIFGFRNNIRNMIEKYAEPGEDLYFYRNLTNGRISGIEGELYAALGRHTEMFINFHYLSGKELDLGGSLNHIPPTRLTFWGKHSFGNFWLEPKVILSSSKRNPGPLEIETESYVLFDTILGFHASNHLTLMAIAGNILNQTYRASSDEQGVDAPGMGVVLKVRYTF
jgi:iron complex outermembrane receptor protein